MCVLELAMSYLNVVSFLASVGGDKELLEQVRP